MEVFLDYGKMPWTYFWSTEKYHGPISRVRKDTIGLLLEYGKIPWTYFESTERYHGPNKEYEKISWNYF